MTQPTKDQLPLFTAADPEPLLRHLTDPGSGSGQHERLIRLITKIIDCLIGLCTVMDRELLPRSWVWHMVFCRLPRQVLRELAHELALYLIKHEGK